MFGTAPRFGIGFGLSGLDFELDATDGEFVGSFNNSRDGYYIYLFGH